MKTLAHAASVTVVTRPLLLIVDVSLPAWRVARIAGTLQREADGEFNFCISPGENVYRVVVATPTE